MADLKAHYEANLDEAMALAADDGFAPPLPVSVFLKEASAMAEAGLELWEPREAGGAGLRKVAKLYPKERIVRLQSLLAALSHADAQVNSLAAQRSDWAQRWERAGVVRRSLSADLSLVLDDGVDDEDDDALDQLKARRRQETSAHELGRSLLAWAALAERLQARLEDLEGFDPALIDEAKALGAHFLGLSDADPSEGEASAEEGREALREARELRKRFYRLAWDALKELQRKARHVFAHEPAQRARFGSTHQREAAAEQRRARLERAAQNPNPA
jgi:uncharacterized alpha-E superfamily protein